jgi:hypothetical protein
MRRLLYVFVVAGLLYGARSLVTSTSVGMVNYPSTTPYTNVSDLRMEIRLTGLSPCKSASTGNGDNLVRFSGLHLGCTQLNTKSLAMESGGLPAPIIATSTQLGSVTDVVLRLQKLTASGTLVAEVWSTSTRTLLASRTIAAPAIATKKGSMAGYQVLLRGAAGSGTTNIAWIRVYNTTVPTGSSAPSDDSSCNTSGDCIARWEFEGSLAGTGFGGSALQIEAMTNPMYVQTPTYTPPSALYTISGAIAPSSIASGATVTLGGPVGKTATADTSGKFTFSGLANGTYTLKPTKTGVVFSPAMQTLTINGANATANFTAAAATQTWNISGTVSGSTATVTLSGTAAASTTTDSTGKYSFTGLKNGSYVVAPSKSGYTFAPSTALVNVNNASTSGVNFTAQAARSGVTLSWRASTSPNVTSYNVYRATRTGGPYTKVSTSPVSTLAYVDSSVSSGQVYYYVATSMDSKGNESKFSTEAVATVPAS